MKSLKKIDSILCHAEEISAVAFFTAMCFVVLWSVICRYVLHMQFGFGEELARYLMIYGIFIGISVGVRRSTHLGVEAFAMMMPKKAQHGIDTLSSLICFVIYVALFVLSIQLLLKLSSTTQTSPAMHLPIIVPYFSMCIGLGMSSLRAAQIFYCNAANKEIKKDEVDI